MATYRQRLPRIEAVLLVLDEKGEPPVIAWLPVRRVTEKSFHQVEGAEWEGWMPPVDSRLRSRVRDPEGEDDQVHWQPLQLGMYVVRDEAGAIFLRPAEWLAANYEEIA